MIADQGVLIVLEGVDGSGKTTQFRLLAERLRAVGYELEVFDFPRYEEESSYFVRRYLNGDYGPASEVSPYSASLFYALDRFEAAPAIRKALEAGKIVLCNRYVGSSMAHQGSKFGSEAEQRGFFIWVESLEYQLLDIPRPNLNIFLRLPAEISFELIGRKNKRQYTDKNRDEHEADIGHLRRSVETYDTLCKLFPKDFMAIECSEDKQLLSVPAVNNLIWQTIQPLLSGRPTRPARSATVRLNENPEIKPETRTITKAKVPPKEQSVSLLALLGSLSGGKKPLGWQYPGPGYGYYLPGQLQAKSRKDFRAAMDSLAAKQTAINAKLLKFIGAADQKKSRTARRPEASAAARLITPLSAYVSVALDQAPAEPDAKIEAGQEIASLAEDRLGSGQSTDLESLELLQHWPRNEFEILANALYKFSDSTLSELKSQIESWSYEQKSRALGTAVNQGGEAIGQIRYRFDCLASLDLLLELQSLGCISELELQKITPRYGYGIPKIIEDAGLEEEFVACFDLSLGLFSQLQASGHEALAAYATLLGHKNRFQFSADLHGLSLMAVQTADEARNFAKTLIDKISEYHPIIAGYLDKLAQGRPKTKKGRRKK